MPGIPISEPLRCPRCTRFLSYRADDIRRHPSLKDAATIPCRACGEHMVVSVLRTGGDSWIVKQWAAKSSKARPGSLEYAPLEEGEAWLQDARRSRARP